jgi:Caudovirales tail fibre assembly protein.
LLTEYVPPPPTPEEILASQSVKLQQLTQLAASQKTALTNRIGVINDGIELGEATPAEVAELPVRQAQLIEWKRYALYLGRVTTQVGWPPDVVWPTQPAEGMDLTVSAAAPETI